MSSEKKKVVFQIEVEQIPTMEFEIKMQPDIQLPESNVILPKKTREVKPKKLTKKQQAKLDLEQQK